MDQSRRRERVSEGAAHARTTQSRAECYGIVGNPAKEHVSTSYVERANLTMRMHMRRFTRLTNAFSKMVDNHAHAVALHMMYYNFCPHP
jgi:IS1 family transposase